LAARCFRAKGFHGFGAGADESDAGISAGPRERGVFGEETVAGMDGVAPGAPGYVDDFIDAEIAFAGGGGPDWVGFVSEADVEGFAVDFAEDGGGADAEFAAGSEDANSDFTAIGDQDFLKHAL
jgi:hypothetical protein